MEKKLSVISPAEMIRDAVSGGADLTKLEKLLELQERWEKNEARKAYNVAMSLFKADVPIILKSKKVSFGNTNFSHAELDKAVSILSPFLSRQGLSHSWITKQNGKISVTCRITHILGHFEDTPLEADADTSGSKNSIQSLGSTITYLERYTLFAALGIAAKGQDDDGKGATLKINEKQLSTILDLLTAKELSEKNLLKFLNIEKLEDLNSSDYMKAIAALNSANKEK